MSEKKNRKLFLVLGILVVVLSGGLYYVLNKKYYPKVESVEYLNLDISKDTAQVKVGLQVQNYIPLHITIDSINYSITNRKDTLGWGQMTSTHTLPPLGDQILDFRLLLDFEKYRKHLQQQQEKDSLRLDVAMKVYFDLPLLSSQSISLNRNLTVPVAKAPALTLQDIVVQHFSADSGYTFLLRINAANKNIPGLTVNNFKYDIKIGDSLFIDGSVDTTFKLQQGSKLLEVPLHLETSEAIALIKKKLTGDNTWNYMAQVEAQIESDHPLFDSFKLTVEKSGNLDLSKMGSGTDYLPTIQQVKRLGITSDEQQTKLQANIVVHNPAPIPFYIDSTSYFIRHQGKVIAKGLMNIEKTLPKAGNQNFNLQLLVDESAYQQLMREVQNQQQIALNIELNLLYNLPNAQKQKITLQRQLRVPVPGQAGIQVAGLEVKNLSPEERAHLGLKLKVKSNNLPNLSIQNLTYKLQLSKDILLTGKTTEPLTISEKDAIVEIPIRLSATDLNQLIQKAIKGNSDWKYKLDATATLQSDNQILEGTRVALSFEGELEIAGGGMGSKQLMPQITRIDTLDVAIHYDTAWVKLHINVNNPLPVAIGIDSLFLSITHETDTFAISRGAVNKVLPAEGSQAAWVTLAVNYSLWREHLQHHQEQDSMLLTEDITLVYRIGELSKNQVSFANEFLIPMPKVPVTELKKVKPKGFSFTKGIRVQALVQVQNANTKGLELSNVMYNICVENLLDVCGTINRTYDIPLGKSTVAVPMHLGVGEVFRAVFARLSGNKKRRNLFLNAEATISTANPKLQNTFIRFEKWERMVLFQKQKQAK